MLVRPLECDLERSRVKATYCGYETRHRPVSDLSLNIQCAATDALVSSAARDRLAMPAHVPRSRRSDKGLKILDNRDLKCAVRLPRHAWIAERRPAAGFLGGKCVGHLPQHAIDRIGRARITFVSSDLVGRSGECLSELLRRPSGSDEAQGAVHPSKARVRRKARVASPIPHDFRGFAQNWFVLERFRQDCGRHLILLGGFTSPIFTIH
jgi:hypothetical protein